MGGGGYVAGPVGLAAARRGIPLVLTEADSHLGLANRLLARRARRVCLAFPIDGRDGERYLVTGRPGAAAGRPTPPRRARASALGAGGHVVLVIFGGSLGARSINDAAVDGVRRARSRASACCTPPASATSPDLRERAARRRTTTCAATSTDFARGARRRDLVVARSGGSIFEIAAAGQAGDPRALPARRRRPPGGQRALDGAAPARRSSSPDAELTAERLASEVDALLADRAAAGARWRAPRRRWRGRTRRARSPTRSRAARRRG